MMFLVVVSATLAAAATVLSYVNSLAIKETAVKLDEVLSAVNELSPDELKPAITSFSSELQAGTAELRTFLEALADTQKMLEEFRSDNKPGT